MLSDDMAGNWTACTLALWEKVGVGVGVEVEVEVEVAIARWIVPTVMIFETRNNSNGILDVYDRPFPQPAPEPPCSP